MLRHFPPLKHPQLQLPNRYLLKHS
jgi:hypothetical protein